MRHFILFLNHVHVYYTYFGIAHPIPDFSGSFKMDGARTRLLAENPRIGARRRT
jgi:hypothetical protein